ncbi:MAG TPA: hypothetical protein VGC09_14315 [Rhodopila sp.]
MKDHHLRMLAVAAIAVPALASGIVLSEPAKAEMRTYYHVGAWDAFSGRNDQGGAVCGVGNTNPADNRRLSIRFDIGGTETVFSASKPEWSIPDNTRIRVVMQVGLNTPWTEQATGHGHEIEWPMDRMAFQSFDAQFRGATSMTLTFPDGNEPPWTVPLTGSSAISDTFGRCVRDLTRQVQSSGPAAPPPQAAPQSATQPFSRPPDAPPAGPAPADTAPPSR